LAECFFETHPDGICGHRRDHSLLSLVEDSAAVHMHPVLLADVFRAGLGAEVALVTTGSQNFLEEVIVLLRLHFLRMFLVLSFGSVNKSIFRIPSLEILPVKNTK